MTVLVYVVMLPITGCAVTVVINPAGPVHTVFTVTGTSTAGSNSTVQVRVTLDPTAMVLLLMVTVGVGTRGEYDNIHSQSRAERLSLTLNIHSLIVSVCYIPSYCCSTCISPSMRGCQ